MKLRNFALRYVTSGFVRITKLLKNHRFQPIAANVVRVLAADGAATQMSTNIPLEEICHTDDMLEIKPIGNDAQY